VHNKKYQALLKCSADADRIGASSVLDEAVLSRRSELVQLLLANKMDDCRRIPLHVALRSGNDEAVQALLK